MRTTIAALCVGMTVAACSQGAPAPSYPSQSPPRSVPAATTPAPPSAFGSPPRDANQSVPPAQFAPGAAPPPNDIAIGQIGPQPQPGEDIVTVPDGDWTYLAPPDTGTAPPTVYTAPPEPDEAPDTGPAGGE